MLIVEDDRVLTEVFSAEGYLVDVAHDGQQGLHRGLVGAYDVVVVDRGLPVLEGSELVAILRSRGIETPAIILTARGSVADRVEGLDAGAQDYVVKPFEIPELLARVRALIRRPGGGGVVSVGALSLDRITRTVSGGGVGEVELSEHEAALLAVLMGAPRRIFTRGQLLGGVFDGSETPGEVDTYVHYLRRKLGKDIVHTVRGTGYRFGSA